MQNRISVDFNEMVSSDEVLLSRDDHATDRAGRRHALSEGIEVGIYSDDGTDFADGTPGVLIADGIVRRNTHSDWSAGVKWLLEIDERGIRHVRLEDVS